jgi:hypothetical protein
VKNLEYCKENLMKMKNRLLLIAALFVLALPMIFAGTASARYMDDGAAPATTGGFVTPNDMVCIVGVHQDGTLDVADGVTNARDCIYLQTGTMNGGTPFDLTGMTSSAACTTAGGAGNDGAKHSWATSFCTKSLKGLDRTQQMCEGIGGTWITTGKCVAYGRQFAGQDATGTPLTFGAKGTTTAQNAGYCYATLNFTAEAGYTSTTCPSAKATTAPFDANVAYDWSFTSSQCRYAKGIAGLTTGTLTKANGSTIAAGTYVDLSTYTTMGDCLANGGSWNNWTNSSGQPTSISNVTGSDTNQYKRPVWDYTKQAPDADNGCLHCHSTLTEYNGPAEREKDSYLKTGHKNMLRKVIPGNKLTDPDGVAYTTDGTNTINFMTSSDSYGKITVGGVDQNLYYIYGDWMAPLPSVVYGTNGYGNAPGATNGYSCGACHTTGYGDNSNIGVLGIGTAGFKGVQPQASFPGIVVNAANPKWDVDGITCGRCHNAAVGPINTTMINASSFPSTYQTSGGMGSIPGGPAAMSNYSSYLCFQCHGGGSMAKAWPANSTQYDPTLVATGVSHGAAAGRDFNGHILGQSFLNSPHAQFTGTTQLNALGKYDLTFYMSSSPAYSYDSDFQGYTCWQSSTSNSPAKTKADGSEIKTKADCESLYGSGAWRSDTQGSCTTCHDVHNSLFVADQEEKAIKKTCENCHVDNASTGATIASAPQVVVAAIAHPGSDGNPLTTPGTPFDTTMYESPCVVCHMATQAQANGDQNSMPVHEWRISTDANYSTFPTTAQFYGGSCDKHTGAVQNAPYLPVVYLSDTSSANCTAATGTWTAVTQDRNAQTAPDGAYTKAVWVDLDLACGQCHGGSFGATEVHNGAPYMNKAGLAAAADGMHNGVSNAPVTPPSIDCGATLPIQVGPGGMITINPAVTSGSSSGETVVVAWGDGVVVRHPADAAGPFTHTYGTVKPFTDNGDGTFNITITAIAPDGGMGSNVCTASMPAAAAGFSGTVVRQYLNSDCTAAGAPVACCTGIGTGTCGDSAGVGGAFVYLQRKDGNGNVLNTYVVGTDATGAYSFNNIALGTYDSIWATKSGYTFDCSLASKCPPTVGQTITATNK